MSGAYVTTTDDDNIERIADKLAADLRKSIRALVGRGVLRTLTIKSGNSVLTGWLSCTFRSRAATERLPSPVTRMEGNGCQH